jgi:hypothetical protein
MDMIGSQKRFQHDDLYTSHFLRMAGKGIRGGRGRTKSGCTSVKVLTWLKVVPGAASL